MGDNGVIVGGCLMGGTAGDEVWSELNDWGSCLGVILRKML